MSREITGAKKATIEEDFELSFFERIQNFFSSLTGKGESETLFSRSRRKFETEPFSKAEAPDKRKDLRKALVAIHEGGFYTFEGLASLTRNYYARQRDELKATLAAGGLKPREAEEIRLQIDEREKDVQELKHGVGDQKLAAELKRLCEQERNTRKYVNAPKGKRLRLVYDFFKASGLLKHPIPMKWVQEDPAISKSVAYNGGNPDVLYHSLRLAMGQADPLADFTLDEREKPQPFAGAVYESFIFDNPYFKRGVFVVRNGDKRGPVEVEYYEGWDDTSASGPNGSSRHRFEEYYRGYLIDQGYDSYAILFGPQEPGFQARDRVIDDAQARLLCQAMEFLMSEFPSKWVESGKDVAAFLRSLPADEFDTKLNEFLAQCDSALRDMAVQMEAAGAAEPIPTVKAMANFSGRRRLLDSPYSRAFAPGAPQLTDRRQAGEADNPVATVEDFSEEAGHVKAALWRLFEVDGKPVPKSGKTMRMRTLYLEGANRNDLTPNMLKGSVQAFDNLQKSEMLMEKTILYRREAPIDRADELAWETIEARFHSKRFDMRMRDHDNQNLEDFQRNYREIFLALGYDVAPAEEEHKPYRIDPIVNSTGSDTEEMEFIIE